MHVISLAVTTFGATSQWKQGIFHIEFTVKNSRSQMLTFYKHSVHFFTTFISAFFLFFLVKLKEMAGKPVMKGLSKICGHSEDVGNVYIAKHKYSAETNARLASWAQLLKCG